MRFKNCVRYLLGLSVAVMLLGMPVRASDFVTVNNGETITGEEEPVREEEYVWFYRTYEGRRQKRLWSLTYQRWVTDWIDIGPA